MMDPRVATTARWMDPRMAITSSPATIVHVALALTTSILDDPRYKLGGFNRL